MGPIPAHTPPVHWDGDEPYLDIPSHPGFRITPYRDTEQEVLDLIEHSNAPEVAKWSYARPSPYTAEDARSWLDYNIPIQTAAIQILLAARDVASAAPEPAAEESGEPGAVDVGAPAATTASLPFMVVRTPEGRLVGDVNLHRDPQLSPEWVVSYALHPEYHGCGLASAAVRPLIAWVREGMGITVLDAIIEVDNVPSIVLVSRLGFARMRTFMHPWPASKGGAEHEVGLWSLPL